MKKYLIPIVLIGLMFLSGCTSYSERYNNFCRSKGYERILTQRYTCQDIEKQNGGVIGCFSNPQWITCFNNSLFKRENEKDYFVKCYENETCLEKSRYGDCISHDKRWYCNEVQND